MIEDLQAKLGLEFFDYQLEAFAYAQADQWPGHQRLCYYYPTGKGKSLTSLVTMLLWQQVDVLVLAPPSTHPEWVKQGHQLGIDVTPISHAKFRQKEFKVRRDQAVIVDEFHLLGGNTGQGWKKLDRLSASLQAPLIVMSATPNYNDAERCYCIQHVLDANSCRGGFLEFLYKNCRTEQNPFGMTPNVTGFLNFPDAAAYLASLPHVMYLPDDLVYTIHDVPLQVQWPAEFETYGYDRRNHRMVASLIEERHKRINLALINDDGLLRFEIYHQLIQVIQTSATPVLVFAAHSTVAEATAKALAEGGVEYGIVTGSTPEKMKNATIEQFRQGQLDVLVGTASLATGTDGLDKVSDMLVILDDTDDASLRRQLVGRIMPRGADGDATKKQVFRFVLP